MTLTLVLIMALTLIAGAVGCDKPRYPTVERPFLQTTISSDGKMVAALDRIGTEQPRLRVIRVDDGSSWKELPAPPYTTSIHFGLNGYDLLLTHHIGDHSVADLLKWNIVDPSMPMERIYRSSGLAFPMEISPDKYLVRECRTSVHSPEVCQKFGGNQWRVLTSKHTVGVFSKPIGVGSYSQPNLIDGKGFFWKNLKGGEVYYDGHNGEENKTPSFLIVPFGEEEFLDLDELEVEGSEITNVRCDFNAERCLRSFVSHKDRDRLFVYDVDFFYKGSRCYVEGLQGYSDGAFVTPYGNAAVMSLATRYDQVRNVVVMRFEFGKCEPVSIQYIQF
jgi:hypothetical protein